MKVFMVTMALIVVSFGMFVFRTDMDRYILLQNRLKSIAEECAEAAAMCIDTARSAESGYIVIDFSRAQKAAETVLERTGLMLDFASSGRTKPYDSGSGPEVNVQDLVTVDVSPEGSSGVRAVVSWTGPDIFRLLFINKKAARRSAAYEWLR